MNQFAVEIIDALTVACIEWNEYSGRGMCGEQCVSVHCGRDVSEGEVLEAVATVPGALRPTRDQLGLGTVLYWPRAKIDEKEKA